MSDAIYESVFGSLRNAIIHASTFSENSLSMRAGLATLQVLDHYRLGQRGAQIGERLRLQLRSALSDYEMVKEIRGAGLLSGIVFAPPQRLRQRVAFERFRKVHTGVFGQVLVMRMFHDHGFLTQVCGNNFMVLKVAPPWL
jgi:ornithine--oxo-acid transaminase